MGGEVAVERLDADVVDKNIDPAARSRLAYQRLAGGRLGDVGVHECDRTGQGCALGFNARAGFRVHVGAEYIGPGLGKRSRYPFADALGSPRNNHGLAVEFAHNSLLILKCEPVRPFPSKLF